MPKPRVYVETTIPSFYHEARSAPDIVARREWTRQWWDSAPECYDLLPSPAVLDDLIGGIPERSAQRVALVRNLPLLPIEPAIVEIVRTYIQYKKCDFLVTWNCRHLANANKFGHIRRVNAMLGLFVPALVTPLELLGGSDETESE